MPIIKHIVLRLSTHYSGAAAINRLIDSLPAARFIVDLFNTRSICLSDFQEKKKVRNLKDVPLFTPPHTHLPWPPPHRGQSSRPTSSSTREIPFFAKSQFLCMPFIKHCLKWYVRINKGPQWLFYAYLFFTLLRRRTAANECFIIIDSSDS